MSARYDSTDGAQRAAGVAEAAAALRKGELAVLPTDTVYGIAADAFTPAAVAALLEAKGRGRHMPPPVLVGTVRAALALVADPGPYGKDLMDEFWPGGLTLVLAANPALAWDLGDTKGTVAVRMPLHPVALELLKETGPLAVSSANKSGFPAATTAADAEAQLGDAVAVYLDGGPCEGDVPSTILDLTGAVPRLLRAGVISAERLQTVIPLAEEEPTPGTGEPAPGEQDAGQEEEPGVAPEAAVGPEAAVAPEPGVGPEAGSPQEDGQEGEPGVAPEAGAAPGERQDPPRAAPGHVPE